MNCQVSVPSKSKVLEVLKLQSDVRDGNLGTSPRAILCLTRNIPLFSVSWSIWWQDLGKLTFYSKCTGHTIKLQVK